LRPRQRRRLAPQDRAREPTRDRGARFTLRDITRQIYAPMRQAGRDTGAFRPYLSREQAVEYIRGIHLVLHLRDDLSERERIEFVKPGRRCRSGTTGTGTREADVPSRKQQRGVACDSPEDQAWREEVRGFTRRHLPPAIARKSELGLKIEKQDYVGWQKVLNEHGMFAAAWPRQYGCAGIVSLTADDGFCCSRRRPRIFIPHGFGSRAALICCWRRAFASILDAF